MYKQLSPENSEYVFGISAQAIDPVDLHFLQTSGSISLEDFVCVFNDTMKKGEDELARDFSLITEFGPVRIGKMHISDHYFEYFKKAGFIGFDDSIVFYTEVYQPTCERIMFWPLLSENIYLLDNGMLRFEDSLPFYEQTIELESKSKVIKCAATDGAEIPYVEKVSFSRVYHTGKRKFWSRAIRDVRVVNDVVLYEGWKQSDPKECWVIKRQEEEPMWLVRHQDEVEFLEEPRRFVGMSSC